MLDALCTIVANIAALAVCFAALVGMYEMGRQAGMRMAQDAAEDEDGPVIMEHTHGGEDDDGTV